VSRKVVAIAVLLIWATGLALIYRRQSNRTPDQQLAEVGLRVSPEAFYYTLTQNGRNVGVVASAIDTSKTRVVFTDLVRGKFPTGTDTLRIEARAEARYTRGMRLRDFVLRTAGDLSPFTLRGVMQEGEEKTLSLTVDAEGERPITQEMLADRPLFTPTAAALPLMLTRSPKVGDSVVVAMFDPMARSIRNVTLHIEADSLFLIADSASLDSTSHHWVKAHQDSLRGYRITGKNAPVTAWVDAAGRLIAGSEPGGVTLTRTAFELAFENWRIDNAGTPADVPPPPKKRKR
jgi:hypothetical protein